MDYLLAIDQGTTGTTALLVDRHLNCIAQASEDFAQSYPQPGWVEHDLEAIYKTVLSTIASVTAGIDSKKIISIGITNQRETLCFWDQSTGIPIAPAIVWQDRRTSAFCEQLKAKGAEPYFQQATGLLLDPYFSGTKVAWALKNWSSVQSAHRAGTLAIGTIDSYLVARLTAGSQHVTEPSNASRTLCFHLHQRKWSPDLCSDLGVPVELLPEVRPSTGFFGKTCGVTGLPDGVPITGILGDQQAALLGQACVQEGTAKCTFGTGAFLLMNTGKKPVMSRHRLLTTIAWAFSETDVTYALEGSVFVAGAAVRWARDGLGLIEHDSDIELLAASVKTSDGVVFVPSLTGMGAPHWRPEATGSITGITRGTTRAHLARAILEGIAFQNVDILMAMQKDLGKPLLSLNVDGGASMNSLLMQIQSDFLGVQLRRPKHIETTSLGAVFAAGLGAKVWNSIDEIQQTWQQDREFIPQINAEERAAHLMRWQKALKA